jgi:hypothetical protein
MIGRLDRIAACASALVQHFVRKCASHLNHDVGHVSEGFMEAWETV